MTDLNSDRYKSKIQIVKHFVYRWDNKITNEYYIGKHSGREEFKLITAALQTMCKEIQEKNNGKNE